MIQKMQTSSTTLPLNEKQGWNQQKKSTYQVKYSSKSSNFDSKQPSLRDLILE
jgi:hypothetical protein